MGYTFDPFIGNFVPSGTGGGPGGSPGGNPTDVQFNNSGAFGGSDGFTWNNATTNLLSPGGTAELVNITETVTQSNAAAGAYLYPLNVVPTIDGNGVFAGAGALNAVMAYNGGAALTDGMYGVATQAQMFNGSAANIYGVWEGISVLGGASVVNAYGLLLTAPDFSTGTGTVLYQVWSDDLGGEGHITNKYYSWFDSQGVRRVREDATFNAIGQAIEALYNPQFTKYTAGATNFERIILGQWESNVANVTTEAGGTGTLRAMNLGHTGVQVQMNTVNLPIFNATGGTGQYVKQSSAGGAVTVGTIAAADLPGSFSGFANPTQSIDLSTHNGAATTAMRSDAAPALSVAIAPTWTGAHTWQAISTFAPSSAGLGNAVTITGNTETTNTNIPLLITQTWNASGVTFTGLKENITSTASADPSLLMDLQLGSTSRFNVGRGSWTATSGTDAAVIVNPSFAPVSTSTMIAQGLVITPTINYSAGTPGAGNYEALRVAVTETALPTGTNYLIRCLAGASATTDEFGVKNNGVLNLAGGNIMTPSATGIQYTTVPNSRNFAMQNVSAGGWASGVFYTDTISFNFSSGDTFLGRDAAATLAQRNGTNAQGFNLYNTFTSSTNFERLMMDWITTSNVAMIYTQKGSGGGTARVLQVNYGGTTTSAISVPITSGAVTFGQTIKLGTIYTVATLPTGSEGMVSAVNDALAPTFLGTLTGGGTVHTPVYHNGTAWVSF